MILIDPTGHKARRHEKDVTAVVEVRDNIRQNRIMDKSTIIARLREYEGELKAAGVERLLLHGSYARGTAIRVFGVVGPAHETELPFVFPVL